MRRTSSTAAAFTRSATLRLLGTLPLLALLAACSDNVGDPLPVASIQVTPNEVSLQINESRQFSATLRTARGTPVTGPEIRWASSDTLVATVSAAGLVSARAAGPATITASSEGRQGHAQILVAPPPVESVTLSTSAATLEEGEQLQLTATPRDAQQNPIAGLGIQWRTSDEGIAQVGALGQVTAIRTGTVTITARVHGKEASATVTVTASYGYDLLYAAQLGQTTNWDLYRLDLRDAAGQPARLLPEGVLAYLARSSPDGGRIAFAGAAEGETGIFVVNRDGSGLRALITSARGEVGAPTLHPESPPIAFIWRQPGEQWGQIWVGNVDGELNPVSLTADLGDARVRTPAWSPPLADGTSRIAYVHQINGVVARLWTMRPDGSDKRQLTTGDVHDDQPAWSPDGQTIAFERINQSGSALWLVNAAGGNERVLVTGPGRQVDPAWSPDGRLIAFASQHESYGSGNPTYQVYTVWADGTKVARRAPGQTQSRNPAWLPRP